MRTWLTDSKYFTTTASTNLIRRGLEDIRSLPGVAAASATCCLPLLQGFYGQPFEIVSRPPVGSQDAPAAGWSVVSPAFFDVFHIPLKRGRVFNDGDNGEAPEVAIISERMAKEYWKDRDPLQDRIVIGQRMMKEFQDEPPRQIVGIVGDLRNEKLNAEPLPMMYVPQAQLPNPENAWLARNGPWTWAIRTYVSPRGLVPAIREQLRKTTRLPVSNILSMDEVMSRSTEKQRFNMLIMTIFGCAALLLAAIGVYGLMAYTVEQRTHEIGIRLAIGAEVSRVRNMVVRQGMCLALIGVVVGIGTACGLSRLMNSLLFGVNAQDPLVFVVVPAILTAVALLAVWLPANRASRVNPIDALRYE